ncbi:hypothetical protein AB0D04_40830 [Streptomyces sp. NPDC048483]
MARHFALNGAGYALAWSAAQWWAGWPSVPAPALLDTGRLLGPA